MSDIACVFFTFFHLTLTKHVLQSSVISVKQTYIYVLK